MDAIKQGLRAYYEAEAAQGSRTALPDRRQALVAEFIALLHHEHRRSVVDFGSGPGLDGERFVAGGLAYLGVDLSVGNARLARKKGLTVVPADLSALPFVRHSLDAGWSMSTLMHLPEEQVSEAVHAMRAALAPGAPMCIGLWGGEFGDVMSEHGLEDHQRFFSLRTFERNAALISVAGRIEWSTTMTFDQGDWSYQLFRLRTFP